MPFAQEDLTLKKNIPTLALDTSDDFKFSQLVETVKDTFVRELRTFFAQPVASAARLAEVLNIEKYAIAPASATPLETAITLIREFPDIMQKLPMIAVTKSSGSQRPVGVTGAFVDHVQYPPRLRSSNPSPFNLSSVLVPGIPPRIIYSTRPDGVTDVTSTALFPNRFFPTPSAVTAQQLADAINLQALYARARVVTVGASTFLEIFPGGPLRLTPPAAVVPGRRINGGEPTTPNRIAILNGSTAGLLTALGYSVGQSDDSNNVLRPPCNRYATSANFTIGLDIGAESDNERTEITDLLIYFLNLYMNDRDYTFYGQHVFEEAASGVTTERLFQIIMTPWSMAGEADIARPDGEREKRIYVNRFNIPIIVYDYVDRIIPSTLIPPDFKIAQFTFLPNAQPIVITGVKIVGVDDITPSGTGTLTFVAGTTNTLQWQAPGQGSPGTAVAVGAGGKFTLNGGTGGSPPVMTVRVSATGLKLNSSTQPVNITGVTIVTVGATNAAGSGTLALTVSGAARNMTWAPPGSSAGAAVDVQAGGTFTLIGANGATVQIIVVATSMPTTNQSDAITITTTYTDSIVLTRDEIPAAS